VGLLNTYYGDNRSKIMRLKKIILQFYGAFTLAIFVGDFTLSLHVLLKKYFFSLLNVQA
jgi:hypothetical protein